MAEVSFPAITHVVTDIEGTTSSISFVKDVLFPYARQSLPEFLQQHWHEDRVQTLIEAAATLAGQPLPTAAAAARLLQTWIDEDRKATPLKTLQGMIWKTGYQQGHYQAHLYEDTAPCLQAWFAAGKKLYVYSSGSIAAQQLFFSHSIAGDISPLFSGYFDTTTGAKQDPASYQAIQRSIGAEAQHILFLSDVIAELDAARQCGMHTVLLDREQASAPSQHPVASSFAEIHI